MWVSGMELRSSGLYSKYSIRGGVLLVPCGLFLHEMFLEASNKMYITEQQAKCIGTQLSKC